jgi:CDP-6-deoxy-D-xylo-4-hexulose-3-dehydrase
MSVKQKVHEFIDSLQKDEENLFSYLANNNWSPGNPVYYSGPYWDEKEVTAAVTALLAGKWASAGEQVNKFEKEFSIKFGFDHSVMVNSGSSANLVMIAALKKYFGWKDGDEIIVCACGFPTTIAPVVQAGLKPVFVDIDWDDLNWNLDQIESSITNKTRAVFSSPVLGNSYDLDRLIDICEKNDIHIIADNCDSLGSKWKESYLTDRAVASSCSFYAAHHICTIEGGMVSSNISEVVDIARSYAWWGRGCYCVGKQNLLSNGVCGKRFSNWLENDTIVDHKYVFGVRGYNLKPLDLQGAIGQIQIEKFDDIHRIRRKNKSRIQSIFETIPGVRVINEKKESETSWFGVPIICDDSNLKRSLVSYLEDNKVQTRNYFAGNILLHPGYRDLGDGTKYPNASKVLDNVFFVGCAPVITSEMIDYIEEVITNFSKS